MPFDSHLPMYCSPRKPTRTLSSAEKKVRSLMAYDHLCALFAGEKHLGFCTKMAVVSCLLNGLFEHYSWVGFYCVEGGQLSLGPFQGTMGCLSIAYGKGVCGKAWASKETQVVEDVHAFEGHIACDPLSRSEIVVPIFNAQKEVMAVLDVDSDIRRGLGVEDALFLEKVALLLSEESSITKE